jgi:hypothetical protein
MSEQLRTAYVYTRLSQDMPRCRNTTTLAPMFAMYDQDNEMIVDPIPISQVSPEYFWRNSDGYGFDVRNLSVLLRVNFRNLNPHTVVDGADHTRPIWCNRSDLSSLLFHPKLADGIRLLVQSRTSLLNLLSDQSKVLLASAAHELYSATYQGFYDWVADQPQFDTLMQAIGILSPQRAIMTQIETLQGQRRQNTIMAIQTHLNTQAAEHFCEPSGIHRESDLYKVLEFYKAGITMNLIEYLEHLATKRRGIVQSVQKKLEDYRRSRLTAILHRYTRMYDRACQCRRRPKLARHLERTTNMFMLWHIEFACIEETPMRRVFRRRREIYLPSTRQRASNTHVRVFLSHVTRDYVVRINNTPLVVPRADDLLKMLDDTVPHFLDPRKKQRVVRACMAGGLGGIGCTGGRWRKTIRSDNAFLTAQANSWLLRSPFTSWIDALITDGPLLEPSPQVRVSSIVEHIGRAFRDVMYFSIAKNIAVSAPDIFEFELLNRLQLRGGYDDFQGTLLDKLRAAMSTRTCIQDVGGELCELLSVPYAPEDEDPFKNFQCNHTGIPPEIVVRTPVSMVPISHLRPRDAIPELSLDYSNDLRSVISTDGQEDISNSILSDEGAEAPSDDRVNISLMLDNSRGLYLI